MIVICMIGIGICALVLMSEEATPPRPEGDNDMSTTSAQLAQMLADDEKERRTRRFELGISSAQFGTRIPHKRHTDVKGNRGNQRARGWE